MQVQQSFLSRRLRHEKVLGNTVAGELSTELVDSLHPYIAWFRTSQVALPCHVHFFESP
jgi:hypothetical protein